MSGTEGRARRLSTAARGLLLAAVLAGLFGMHVLTAGDAGSGHGALPTAGMSGHAELTGHNATQPVPAGDAAIPAAAMPAGQMPAAAMPGDPMPAGRQVAGGGQAFAAVPDDTGGGGDHQAMAGCLLFLVVGGVALILLLLRYRVADVAAGLGRLAGIAVTDHRRRGPPDRWPRVALCVIRV